MKDDATTARHTLGPFYVSHGMIFTVGDPYGHGQMRIADVRGWGHLTGQGACRFSEEKAAAIQDANASLIAAAPDYWDAAEMMSTDASELEGDDAGYIAVTKESYDALMAAHRKATTP